MSRQDRPSLITTSLQASSVSLDSYHPAVSTRHDNRVHIYLLWHFVCQNLWFLPFFFLIFPFFFLIYVLIKNIVFVLFVVIFLPLALVGLPTFTAMINGSGTCADITKMDQQNHGRTNQTQIIPNAQAS